MAEREQEAEPEAADRLGANGAKPVDEPVARNGEPSASAKAEQLALADSGEPPPPRARHADGGEE